MSPDRAALDEALERLNSAARGGNRAKRRLATKLASMTPAQLRRVPPDTFVRLGPDGLRDFAEKSQSRNLRGAATESPPPPKPELLFPRLRRKWHFAHPALKCAVAVALSGTVGIGANFLSERAIDFYHLQNAEKIAGWPKCKRLDRGDWDCVYQTSSDEMTLNRIVSLTHLSPATLAAWNSHLDFRYALPPNSLVVIPRRGAHS